ncbi:MAG: asparagine synthase C-terminal domain-containing protein, partial [Candidatus Dormibacteraeota bacterium]|nr:asparagine synthase C-terminal domain-containing protein [Candidatus Dormibacteraeota bacterium]
LSGQGSDELFGGYRVHMYGQIAEKLARQPEWFRRAASSSVDALPSIARRLPGRSPGLVLAAHRAGRNILDNLDLPAKQRYVANRAAYYFNIASTVDLLTPQARDEALAESPWAFHLSVLDQADGLSFFDSMLYLDYKTFLANQNLAYSDRLSMAASVEMRLPFLDDEVADLALRIPENVKMPRFKGKEVLRRSMAGILPDEIIRRRKAAFAAPIRSWLRSELAPLTQDALSDRWLTATGLFQPPAVRRLVQEHQSGQADNTYRIWTLLTFALWYRTHISSS